MSKINTISVNKVNKRGVYYISFNNEVKSRPCLIMSEAEHYGENILAMTITSRCNIAKLLPVLLNDKVSFIRTTGIIELRPENIALRTYLGDVSQEVYDLAIEMFMTRFVGNKEEINKKYEEYISYFENSRFAMKANPNQIFNPSMLTISEEVKIIRNNHKSFNNHSAMVINKHPEMRKRTPRPKKNNDTNKTNQVNKQDNHNTKPKTTQYKKKAIETPNEKLQQTLPKYKLSEWSVKELVDFRSDSFKLANNELMKKYNCDARRLNFLRRNVRIEIASRKKPIFI